MRTRVRRLSLFAQGLPDYSQKFGIIHGLLEIGPRSRLDCALPVRANIASGNHDNWNLRERWYPF